VGEHDDAFISTFKDILIFLVLFTIAIIVAANYIVGKFSDKEIVADDDAITENIKPMGKVETRPGAKAEARSGTKEAISAETSTAPSATPVAGGEKTADIGKATYDTTCFACHGTGVAGAPKVGDKKAWASRIAQGIDVLGVHAINGFVGKNGTVMPAKGGRADLDDEAVKAAVAYIVSQSK